MGINQYIELLDKAGGLSINNGNKDITQFFIDVEYFTPIQELVDNYSCSNSFNINGSDYLILLGTTTNIYRWNGTSFAIAQNFNENCSSAEVFNNNTGNYLFLSTIGLSSILYKWDGSKFEGIQTIDIDNCISAKYFEFGDVFYLLTNNSNNSILYSWNGTSFVEVQTLLTNKAVETDAIIIEDNIYIAIAESKEEDNFSTNSRIFKMVSGELVETQSIPTNNALDLLFYTIANRNYLFISNNRKNNTLEVNSVLYIENNGIFSQYQDFNIEAGSSSCTMYNYNGEDYLFIGTNNNNNFSTDLYSNIYKWDGFYFIENKKIFTKNPASVNYISTLDSSLLFIANKGVSSKFTSNLYKFNNPSNVIYIPNKIDNVSKGISTIDTNDMFGDNSIEIFYRFNDIIKEEKSGIEITSDFDYRAGVWGKSLFLDNGLSNFFDGPNGNIIPDDSKHSLSIWIKGSPGETPFFGTHGLSDQFTVGGGWGLGFEYGNIVTNIHSVDNGLFSNSTPVYIGLTKGVKDGILIILNIESNVFTNIAYTYDRTNFKVYKNGVEKISIPYNNGFKSGDDNNFKVRCGSLNSISSNYTGLGKSATYEQARVFNRSLTPPEIYKVFREEI